LVPDAYDLAVAAGEAELRRFEAIQSEKCLHLAGLT
jgi:hypothetical protein